MTAFRDPREEQVFPDFNDPAKRILDIGCQHGYGLSRLKGERYGIDPDAKAIERGRQEYPDLHLQVGFAQKLPFPDGHFDDVYSQVSFPYTPMLVALREARRVMKAGGRLFATFHDEAMQREWFWHAVRSFAVKRAVDHLIHIYPTSILYNTTGICLPRFWNGRYETFQTPARLWKDIPAAGFTVPRLRRTRQHFVAEAVAV
jgi:SAM-dependent methyltransferase